MMNSELVALLTVGATMLLALGSASQFWLASTSDCLRREAVRLRDTKHRARRPQSIR